MAYVDPTDAVSNTIATAADFNIVTADIRDLNARAGASLFQGVALGRSATQSIANAAWTAVAWTTESVDKGSWHAGSSTDIIVASGVIPTAFTSIEVECTAVINFTADNNGLRAVRALLNGAVIDTHRVTAINGDTTSVILIAWMEVVATDVITFEVYQSSGGALTISNQSRGYVKRLGGVA